MRAWKRIGIGMGCFLCVMAWMSIPKIFSEFRTPESSLRGERLDVQISIVPKDTFCEIELTAVNLDSKPLVLKFNTSQRYDFYIRTADHRTIWKWSNNKVFADVLGEETLLPGARLSYTVQWKYNRNDGFHVKGGAYWVKGAVAALPQHRYSEEVRIEAPDAPAEEVLEGQVSDMGPRVYLLADDGAAYQIENSKMIRQYSGKRIRVVVERVEAVPGTTDRKITVRSYRLSDSSRSGKE